jgi:hypothetical protein
MICFLKGMKIDYSAILTASIIKAVFFLNLSKEQRLVPLTTKIDWFFKGMKIDYFAILTASLIKLFSF